MKRCILIERAFIGGCDCVHVVDCETGVHRIRKLPFCLGCGHQLVLVKVVDGWYVRHRAVVYGVECRASGHDCNEDLSKVVK